MASSAANPTAKLLFSLDTPTAVALNSDESYIRGWFVPHDGSAYELWLIVDKTRVKAFTGLPRPDVHLHHEGSPAFKDAGFFIRFKRPQSRSLLRLIAVMKSKEILLADDIAIPVFGERKYDPAACEANAKYQEWLATSERLLFWPEDEISSRTLSLPYRPLISVLVAIPDAHLYLISRCVESVLQQHYPHWELCIACGSSEPSPSREYLEKLAGEDRRLQLVVAEGAGIPELSNRALAVATGDFVLRLDHRDELHPFALIEIARCLNTGNSGEFIDVVYADEDEMDFYGSRLRPFCRPDFDPQTFLSFNFVGNIAAIRRGILLKAGGYGTGTEVLDDWDIMFRVVETTEASRVRHIPRVLYHFRRDDPATAPVPREANNGLTKTGSAKTMAEHLARTGQDRGIEPGLFPGSFRIRAKERSDCQIAVLVRPEDGAFQRAALIANVDSGTTRIYQLLGAGADLLADTDPPAAGQAAAGTLRHLSQMPEDVFVFINRPLDTLNHFFFRELADQAMREDCGLATGISLDWAGRILHSGLCCLGTNDGIDAFAGVHFSQSEPLRNISFVRAVDSISDEFFAVKRYQLVALGGLGAISSARMPDLVRNLVDQAHASNSRVLVTPYAVATFDVPGVSGREQPCSRSDSAVLPEHGVNVTLDTFTVEESMPREDQIGESLRTDDIGQEAALSTDDELREQVKAAEGERKLAAAQLRQMASERNHLRRELAAMEEAVARQKQTPSASLCQDIQKLGQEIQQLNKEAQELKNQICDLNTALEAERRLTAGIQNSLSWKITTPLRACMRVIRGKS